MRKALITLLIALVALAGLEVSLRVRQPPVSVAAVRGGPGDASARPGFYARNDRFLFQPAPHYRAGAGHAGAHARGSWPWRGRPASPAPSGLRRVAIVGESCAYGTGLEVADTLAEHLARELDRRGYAPDRVQVLNLAVPAYSTLQIERVAAWALEELAPDVLLFHPGPWNDASRARSATDAELLAQASGLAGRSALVRGLQGVLRSRPADGEAPRPRVSADEFRAALGRSIARAEAAGTRLVFLSPTHPPGSADEYLAMDAARESLLQVARAHDVPCVDLDDVLGSTDLPGDALFVDRIHAAPALWRGAVTPIADAVTGALGAPAAPAPPGWSATFHPASVSSLGDAAVELDLAGWEGWAPGEPPPSVVVGGAPLLDVRVEGTVLRGTSMRNAPGLHDAVVQSGRAVRVLRAALRLEAPGFERLPEGGTVLLARPGDRAVIFTGAARLPTPRPSLLGTIHLEPDALGGASHELVLDGDGRARLPGLSASIPGPRFAQAMIVPAGCDNAAADAVFTAPIEL